MGRQARHCRLAGQSEQVARDVVKASCGDDRDRLSLRFCRWPVEVRVPSVDDEQVGRCDRQSEEILARLRADNPEIGPEVRENVEARAVDVFERSALFGAVLGRHRGHVGSRRIVELASGRHDLGSRRERQHSGRGEFDRSRVGGKDLVLGRSAGRSRNPHLNLTYRAVAREGARRGLGLGRNRRRDVAVVHVDLPLSLHTTEGDPRGAGEAGADDVHFVPAGRVAGGPTDVVDYRRGAARVTEVVEDAVRRVERARSFGVYRHHGHRRSAPCW